MMTKRQFAWLRIWLTVQLLLGVGGVVAPALAHTEEAVVQMALEPIGPYAMTVWTYPGVMRAGSVHYTVAVVDTASSQPLRNANVTISVIPLDQEAPIISGVALLGSDALYPDYYELDLQMNEKGAYRVDVQIEDASGQKWIKEFQVEIVSATFIKWFTIFLLVQALLFGLWLMRESIQTWGLHRLFASNAADWQKTRARSKRPL